MTQPMIGRLPVTAPRRDLELIASLVDEGSSVLDLGCGDGTLLRLLMERRGSRATGVELSEEGVYACIASGLPVHHADLDEGLADYADQTYDYVILSQTMQAVRKPLVVLREMLRVGRLGIVSLPNFGNWRVRWELLRTGRMPKTKNLPYEWYDTPNIHLATVRDFEELCAAEDIEISRAVYLAGGREVGFWPNLRSDLALFVIRRA
ncbi:MAG: methionine biosynthesis protein MetW [Chloroflexota bacterium]